MAVLHETGDTATWLGTGFLAIEAHNVAVDPRPNLVYFPLQRGSTGRPQLLMMKPL